MPIATVIALIAQVGLPLAQQLIAMWEGGKTTVSAADIQVLIDYGKHTSAASLAAAGIKIVDGKVVPA